MTHSSCKLLWLSAPADSELHAINIRVANAAQLSCQSEQGLHNASYLYICTQCETTSRIIKHVKTNCWAGYRCAKTLRSAAVQKRSVIYRRFEKSLNTINSGGSTSGHLPCQGPRRIEKFVSGGALRHHRQLQSETSKVASQSYAHALSNYRSLSYFLTV